MSKLKYLALVAVAALSSCSPNNPKATPAAPVSSANEATKTVFFGQPVAVGDVEVTLLTVADYHNYPGASESAMAIVVYWHMQNKGDRPLPPASMPNLTLIDDKGVTYNPDGGLTAAFQAEHSRPITRKPASDLSPDLYQTDLAVFEVSDKRFDASTWYLSVGKGTRIGFCGPEQARDGRCPRIENAKAPPAEPVQ